MNNKELYQAAFSRLHASETQMQEEQIMVKQTMGSRKWRKSLVIGAVAAAMLAATASAANIASNGELLRQVKLFVGGEAVNVEDYLATDKNGEEYISVEDKDGGMYGISLAPGAEENIPEGGYSISIP